MAQFAGTDVMMTSQVLRTLEGKGLIARQDSPTDARTKIVSATPAGSALAIKAVRDVEAVDRDFFSLVDDQKLLTLLRSLTED